jgi:predicted cupin superfamily sugar epimerase
LLTAEKLIELLDLKPLPMEGGFFRETYRAEETFSPAQLPARYPSARSFSTAIYYLLTSAPGCFSALHRVASDEVFHFYVGDAVEMLLLNPEGTWQRVELGNDLLRGERPQLVVPRGVWQGARVAAGGSFALLGTTVAPGFDAEDFELGAREELLRRYPQAAELIAALTRAQVP